MYGATCLCGCVSLMSGTADSDLNSAAVALAHALSDHKTPAVVKIMMSFFSVSARSRLPVTAGYTGPSFALFLAQHFSNEMPSTVSYRFSEFLTKPKESLMNLLLFNFCTQFNPAGYDLYEVTPGSTVHSLLNAVSEGFCFLSTLFEGTSAGTEAGALTPVVSNFLVPLRTMAAKCHVSVVHKYVHMALVALHVNTPIVVTLQSHVELWLSKYDLSVDVIAQRCVIRLQEDTIALFVSSVNSTSNSASPSRPVKPIRDNDKSKKFAYGKARGYCLSIFFNKPCKKSLNGGFCSYSLNGKKVPLKHAVEFDKLSPRERQGIQEHFDSNVRGGLSATQVLYYDT